MTVTAAQIVKQAQEWVGLKESDGSHKTIIDIYNSYTPHPRGYTMSYTDSWCAAFCSALGIKLGATDIIPVECGCSQWITLAKNLGIWTEDDAHTPTVGDFVLYDWQDSGSGDNTGTPDHIGIVEVVSGSSFTVIEGNKSDAVGRRNMSVNGKYIRGFVCPKYGTASNSSSTSSTTTATKTIEELAKEVIAGKWGNGTARKTALEKAGYDYEAVQAKVNELLGVSTSSGSSTTTITAGAYKVSASSLNVRSEPSLSGSVVATYSKGQTINAIAKDCVIADGYIWAHYTAYSGKTRYVAYGTSNGKTTYLTKC